MPELTMDNGPESYWRPRVLRHSSPGGDEEFAIHEVHFCCFGNEWGPTVDAVSCRYPTVNELKSALEKFVESGSESLRCGDMNYVYFREDVIHWLEHIDDSVLDYPNE